MEELKDIYDRITYLRQKGVKMKEMAEQIGVSPSVLSAIYSTVLPGYFKKRAQGLSEDEALDDALIWVNNVSKKKLLGSLFDMKTALFSMQIPVRGNENSRNPYLDMLESNMKQSVEQIANYSGIYMSYSISSASQALKMEPYLIAPSENGSYVMVGHNNAYGSTHWGAAIMNGNQHLYLSFNEQQPPQLALFNIYLKIPMFDHPPFLRGLYLCFDYNFNPIARRILFVKVSDSIACEDFLKIKGLLKTFDELTEKEKLYYDYTCQKEDYIKTCNVPSPQLSDDDLALEKKLLSSH